jgi:hypothetical protein
MLGSFQVWINLAGLDFKRLMIRFARSDALSPGPGATNGPGVSIFQTASFAALTGRALTIFRAGLALNTVGSLVKGLMPARSAVAAFLMTTNLAKPGTTKAPFFFISLLVAHFSQRLDNALHVFATQ